MTLDKKELSKRMAQYLCGGLLLMVTVVQLRAQVRGIEYASPAGNDANDGLTWGTAKATWQAAINSANSSVGTGVVYVAPGTYTTNTQVIVNPNVTVYARGAQLLAGSSFPASTALVNIGGDATNDNSKLVGATLNCNDVPGCTGFTMANTNEQSGFADITINKAPGGCGSITTTNSQNWDMGSLYCVEDSSLSSSAIGVLIESLTPSMLTGTGNHGHWTIAGLNGHPFVAGIELYNVGGIALQNIHCEVTIDCIKLTGSPGTGSNQVFVANVVGDPATTNVIHEDGTTGNGNSCFFAITKNGATNAVKDDVHGVTISSAISGYCDTPIRTP